MAIILDGTLGVDYPGGGDYQSIALTRMTAVTSTSGTVIDFTGIPAGAKRITVVFDGVNVSGTSGLLVQIGTSSGIDALTYTSKSIRLTGTTSAGTYTTGFGINTNNNASTIDGLMPIMNVSGNAWVSSHALGDYGSGNHGMAGGGAKTLAGVLDRVRITTVAGTETFNAGIINVMYE